MASIVRLTVQVQKIARRLSGLLLASLMGVLLISWANDPPGALKGSLALCLLLASVGWHGAALVKKRKDLQENQASLGLFSGLTVLVYGSILAAPGGLTGPFYPLIFVLMMASAAYTRPTSAIATVLFASALELGLRTLVYNENDLNTLAPRLGFLALFSGLNVLLFRAEIARIRRLSRQHISGELGRLKDAARSYRLSGASVQEGEERALHSAVGEVQQAVHFALSLLAKSLHLQSAVLLSSTPRGKLEIFEATSNLRLTEKALSVEQGLLSAAVSRQEPISVVGKRAHCLAMVYAETQIVGALAVVPLFEGTQLRAVLVVDRKEERAFENSELELLNQSGDFILRAMQNERVFAALDRSNREQAKLYRAAGALGSAHSEAEVIEAGVESARELAAFNFAAVTLFHRKSGTHEVCAVSGDGADDLVGRSFRHNAGLVSMVVANRQALPYRGEYEPSRQSVFARGHEPPPMPSLLVLPLLAHERVLGTLVLGSSQKHAFTESVRPALEVLSSHMAVSLSSARMLKRLEEQATTDGMTGLLNKRTLIVEAERRIKVAVRFKKPLGMLVVDIDHFKKVNDTYGHDVGDVVIKGLGEVLRRIKRDTDIVGRFGGEEFVIVCEQTDEEGSKNLAERIRRELENTTFQTEMGPLSVTCSVGVAPFPLAGKDWASLFKATDDALYASKNSGRNRVTLWRPNLRSSAA